MSDTQPLSPHTQQMLAKLRDCARAAEALRVKTETERPHTFTLAEVSALLYAGSELFSVLREVGRHLSPTDNGYKAVMSAVTSVGRDLEKCSLRLHAQLGARHKVQTEDLPLRFTALLPALHAMLSGAEPGREVITDRDGNLRCGENTYRWSYRARL